MMRSREEVLREFARANARPCSCSTCEAVAMEDTMIAMADRIRELEARVPTGHTGSDAALPRSVTSQFADVLSIQHREATGPHSTPYMVGLYNGMLMMCCNLDNTEYKPLDVKRDAPEALQEPSLGDSPARGEAVAWGVMTPAGEVVHAEKLKSDADAIGDKGDTTIPLYAAPVAPVAAVVSDEMVEAAAAAFYHEQYGAQGGRYELVNPDHRHLWRDKARAVLTAALTASRGGG